MGATTFWLLEQERKRRIELANDKEIASQKASPVENVSEDREAEPVHEIEYEALPDEELKQIAKERGIPGYFNMKRETLLEKLKG
ncbi:hypothetical protein [Bacillus atrophaeus]|uniref:hypothetical protein n=1 Tax=Bacillus atrophaeus TaxID=1452 RepID=UPI00227F527C|nr:hypothetical protein [Bacillus atrophaeus]MCY8507831.1 hypothetical protein [Bacillus atrophaeus]MCY8969616.1 hypothetical protein [Bacillus atrophaeus]